jgi:RHS repeat-associated protein
VQRASGIESTYGYDKAGRVVKVAHMRKTPVVPKDSTDPSSGTYSEQPLGYERYVYRKDGELVQADNGSCAVKLERDPLGRIVKETQGKHTVQSDYDLLGLRSHMHSSLGADLAIERNAMGDVESIKSAGYEARMQRDVAGLEIERSLPGGVRSRWRRDKLGRPVQHEILAGTTLLRARSYHWDKSDRLRAIIDALQGPVHYTHDALGNLAAATYADGSTELRVPDSVGNLFKRDDRKDRVYGPAGQLLESTDAQGRITRYAYDAEGNLTEKQEGSGRLWKYRWGADGMMSEVERADGTVVRFEYDALGRRVAKHYRGLTTRWVWDGNMPLHEWVEGKLEPDREPKVISMWTADADIKRRETELIEHLTRGPPQAGTAYKPITWLFEPESFSPMAKLSAAGKHSIVCDHLGTPVAMINDAGTRTWSAEVSVYGELRQLEGERFACPFRWPGQYEDAETGLYYNRYRYYDPDAGQYASQDPIGLDGGPDLVAYVRDPLTWSDPLGLSGTCRTQRRRLREIEARAATPGNSGLRGAATRREADQLGRNFVGPNHTVQRGRSGEVWLISEDGRRMYRSPTPKSSEFARTGTQANFHERANPRASWFDEGSSSNVHLHVK